MPCPCGYQSDYEECCGQFHKGAAIPETAESLMRSRYCAFVKNEISYLKETTWPAYQKNFDFSGYQERASNSIWLGLVIHQTENGLVSDTIGTVSFTAKSMLNGNVFDQNEKSLFRRKNDRWYYVKPVD